MAKVPKSGLREVHIDIGSHNQNPMRGTVSNQYPKLDAYILRDGVYEYYSSSTRFRTGKEFKEFLTNTYPEFSFKVSKEVRKNPAPRIGTARPRRASQITKKAPSKRLVARRAANTRRGYFPNPVNDPAKGALELAIVSAIKSAKTPAKLSNKTDNMLTMQARLSYAQGLIQAAEILGVFTRAETKLMLTQLKPEGVIGR